MLWYGMVCEENPLGMELAESKTIEIEIEIEIKTEIEVELKRRRKLID